jgi:hypothetical protein
LAHAPTRAIAALTVVTTLSISAASRDVEVLTPSSALPVHITGRFEEPIGFVQTTTGEYIVLDRRGHSVYVIDKARRAANRVIEIGRERGAVVAPAALALNPDDIFAVADAPGRSQRVQYFSLKGNWIGGFHLRDSLAPRLTVGPLVLNGVGSMQFTAQTFLLNQPETGAVVSELDVRGESVRQIGVLRRTGHEADRDLHLALNVGLPLADPTGGYYFVFQTGVPLFQKYDASGTLVFERHIEGVELDADIQSLPTDWPRRTSAGPGPSLPIVPPLVRTAAVDREGRLWVSLMQPFTYVYDSRGAKIRTVQFKATSVISPASLFFTRDQRLLVTPGCYEFDVR